MLGHLVTVLCSGGIVGIALWLAAKNGSKAAQLEALKTELKKKAEEQQRAQKMTDNVYAFSGDDARRRLHEIATRHR